MMNATGLKRYGREVLTEGRNEAVTMVGHSASSSYAPRPVPPLWGGDVGRRVGHWEQDPRRATAGEGGRGAGARGSFGGRGARVGAKEW